MAVTPAPPAELTAAELAAWKGFVHAYRKMSRMLDAELESAHGLSLSSFEVLKSLRCSPEGRLRMADLAEHALLSRSGMTRLVDRLERQGLLTRCQCSDDARGCFAVLSPAGAALVDRARPTHLENVRSGFLSHLSPEDLERLGTVFARMLSET
jgi:DNA-binding MarR family transcriptional regulator